ncbi:MAG: IPExxxVDY family protein [Reichenbachiella sp.]
MKKVKLQADYTYEFHLIGIVSNSKEYSVSWSINDALHLSLKKEKDLEIDLLKQGKIRVSNYLYESNFMRYSLITNKILNSQDQIQRHFIPSLSSFDYLLKIEELEEVENIEVTFKKLRNAKNIDSIIKLDINKIKEKESFLF